MLKFNRVRWAKVAVVLTTATIMIFGITMFVGCDADKGVYSSAERVPAVEANITSQPESDNEDAASMHTWDDAYGQEIIDKAAKTYTVKSYLNTYVSQGYAFAPEHSFMMEGYGIPDGGTDSMLVQFVTLVMTYTPDPASQAAYVTFTESELGYIIAPYVLSFVEPDPDEGFSVETDGIWRLDYPAEIGHYRGRATDIGLSVDISQEYLRCVRNGTVATCAAAVVGCLWTGPGYPKCVAAGCTAAFVGSVIACAFIHYG